MQTFYSTHLKAMVKQVNITTARKLWEEGATIFFQAPNLSFDNFWQSPMPTSKDKSFTDDFDYMVHDYKYYNCNCGRGSYIKFYVQK